MTNKVAILWLKIKLANFKKKYYNHILSIKKNYVFWKYSLCGFAILKLVQQYHQLEEYDIIQPCSLKKVVILHLNKNLSNRHSCLITPNNHSILLTMIIHIY